jgi:type II secretory pathway component PulC
LASNAVDGRAVEAKNLLCECADDKSERVRALAFLLAAVMASGCGSAPAHPVESPPHPASPASPAAAPPAGDGHRLVRASVKDVVAQGLGVFLQQVELDDQPALIGGKFHGFRIAALHGAEFWSGVDLKPGDVVTSVNGLPIERPEQALAAFQAVASANELRVAYDRGAESRELVYRIVDGP